LSPFATAPAGGASGSVVVVVDFAVVVVVDAVSR
jgi:hypothetical protein